MSEELSKTVNSLKLNVDLKMLYYSRLFLVKLYQAGYFKEGQFENKSLIIEKIKKFSEENNLNIDDEQKICLILEDQKLLEPIIQTDSADQMFKINENNFQKIFDILLEQLDEIQILKTVEKSNKQKENYFSWKELQENFIQDPNEKEIRLCFRTQIYQNIEKNFEFEEKSSCYICQQHFKTQEKYSMHIESHYKLEVFKNDKKSGNKNRRNRNNNRYNNKRGNNNNSKAFQISFRPSLIFSTLRFTIQNIRSPRKNLTVDKIVMVGDNWIFFLMEEDIPFGISTDETKHFYIESDCLFVGERYPIYIIYTYHDYENDFSHRVVEEFFFIQSNNYPLQRKVDIDSDKIMSFIKIKDYYPSGKIEKLCEKKCLAHEEFLQIKPIVREYLDSNKLITPSNLCEIFNIFLEVEDVTKTQLYKKLTTENCKIRSLSGRYQFEFENLPDEIIIKDILKPADEICLIREGTISRIIGTIDKIMETYIHFSLRDGEENLNCDYKYTISFFPNRFNLILQYFALELLPEIGNSTNLFTTLFPETLIEENEITDNLSLNWFSDSIKSNKEQMEAVKNIISGSNNSIPYIIFGPPGTGKTTTVVECILQLHATNPSNRILVMAGSNAACDEIGIRLLKYLKNTNILFRLYAKSMERRINTINNGLKISSNLAKNHQYYPSVPILENYSIIIATLMVAGKLIHGGITSKFFTHIFIDECAASTEPESLIGIIGLKSSETKLILSGDPKQLGPVLENKKIQELGLGTSLLERLLNRDCYQVNKTTGAYNKMIQARLIQNYRTHPDILYLSNSLYYDNELKACASNDITHWALGWYKLPSKNFPIIFSAVRGETVKDRRSSSLYNKAEINAVLRYVKEIMFFGVNDRKITENDIGIISPYRKQSNLLRTELNRRGWYKIETGSVETFQGKEKSIIIVSMVRSNTSGIGFLNSKKRLNVTLTRAQALTIIIGNPFTLQMCSDWKKVIDYCKEHNSLIEYRSRDVPSIFEDQLDLNVLDDCFKNLNIE